jgi:hypothetical protein
MAAVLPICQSWRLETVIRAAPRATAPPANPYGIFIPRASAFRASNEDNCMDLWFIGLIVALALLSFGGVALCHRLMDPQ